MSFPDYDTPIGKEIKSFLSGRRSVPESSCSTSCSPQTGGKSSRSIKSSLRAGEAMIVNRYTESNLAYGKANGLDPGWLASLEKGLPRADLVIVLDALAHTL